MAGDKVVLLLRTGRPGLESVQPLGVNTAPIGKGSSAYPHLRRALALGRDTVSALVQPNDSSTAGCMLVQARARSDWKALNVPPAQDMYANLEGLPTWACVLPLTICV